MTSIILATALAVALLALMEWRIRHHAATRCDEEGCRHTAHHRCSWCDRKLCDGCNYGTSVEPYCESCYQAILDERYGDW